MYDNRLEIGNPGRLHFGLTPEDLTRPHESKPWNPVIAGVLYRAGIIERWGSGTLNILDWCEENGNPPPAWAHSRAAGVAATFWPRPHREPATAAGPGERGRPKPVPSLSQACPKPVPSQLAGSVLRAAESPAGLQELMSVAGQTNRTRFRNAVLRPLITSGLLEMTIPDKPRSSKQKYRLTEKGRLFLETID